MNIRNYLILIFLFPVSLMAQDYSALWKGYFSYLNVKDVTKGNGKIYVAAENAIFSYDFLSSEIETLTTINGLSGEEISAIHYSEAYQMLVIGYVNGLIEIALEDDTNILTVVDILDKPTIPPNDKRVNHFEEYNELLYIAADYGISVYDMSRLEFGDTYYIGSGGSQLRVKQTTISGGYIFAACLDGGGLKRALVNDGNLIDFQQWQTVTGDNVVAVESTMDDRIYIIKANRQVFEVIDTSINSITTIPDPILDFSESNNNLFVTTKNESYFFDNAFNEITVVPILPDYPTEFSVTTFDSEYMYIGTTNYGVLKVAYTNQADITEINPDGPLLNNAFAIQSTPNNLWVTYGGYTLTYNPPLRQRGFSHLIEESWVNVPYDSVLGTTDLNKIAVNPFNNQQVFISSFSKGLLEVNNDVPTVLYDESNSALRSLVIPSAPNYKSIRVSASTFDSNGVLWTMTARVAKPLVSYDPNSNQWNSYDFTDLIPDALEGEWGYSDIEIDANGTKWIGGYKNGLIGYKDGQLRGLYSEEQNMPTAFVSSLAIDKRGQIWIGTINGLRVLYNTAGFFTDPAIEAQSIIVLDDGLPQELLFQTFVSDIEVDGSNNKWIGTIGAGLYYFSSDGQETIYHFTKDNSPLPNNNVVDVAIDQTNGIVYIATDKGLVSYGSGGSETMTTLESAFIFPNPVRPDYNMNDKKIQIRGITENMNIKITDIEGNLVAEAQSNVNTRYRGYNLEIDGGSAYWNGKNLGNNSVASGVYLIMLSDLDSYETKVLKLMVVR